MSAWHLQMVTVHGDVVVVVKYVEFSLYVPPHAAAEAEIPRKMNNGQKA